MKQIQNIAKQLLESVNILHSLYIIHTNITFENILLQNDECEEISNFDKIPFNVRNYSSNLSFSNQNKDNEKIVYKKLKHTEIKMIGFSNAINKNWILIQKRWRTKNKLLIPRSIIK